MHDLIAIIISSSFNTKTLDLLKVCNVTCYSYISCFLIKTLCSIFLLQWPLKSNLYFLSYIYTTQDQNFSHLKTKTNTGTWKGINYNFYRVCKIISEFSVKSTHKSKQVSKQTNKRKKGEHLKLLVAGKFSEWELKIYMHSILQTKLVSTIRLLLKISRLCQTLLICINMFQPIISITS